MTNLKFDTGVGVGNDEGLTENTYEKDIQVSLTIRGGYVPEKSPTANSKTAILSLNYAILDSCLQPVLHI